MEGGAVAEGGDESSSSSSYPRPVVFLAGPAKKSDGGGFLAHRSKAAAPRQPIAAANAQWVNHQALPIPSSQPFRPHAHQHTHFPALLNAVVPLMNLGGHPPQVAYPIPTAAAAVYHIPQTLWPPSPTSAPTLNWLIKQLPSGQWVFGDAEIHHRISGILRRDDAICFANDIQVPMLTLAGTVHWTSCDAMPGVVKTVALPHDDGADTDQPAFRAVNAVPVQVAEVPFHVCRHDLRVMLESLCGVAIIQMEDPVHRGPVNAWNITVSVGDAAKLVGFNGRIVVQSDQASAFSTAESVAEWASLRTSCFATVGGLLEVHHGPTRLRWDHLSPLAISIR